MKFRDFPWGGLIVIIIFIGGMLIVSIRNGVNTPCPYCGWAAPGWPGNKPWKDPKITPNIPKDDEMIVPPGWIVCRLEKRLSHPKGKFVARRTIALPFPPTQEYRLWSLVRTEKISTDKIWAIGFNLATNQFEIVLEPASLDETKKYDLGDLRGLYIDWEWTPEEITLTNFPPMTGQPGMAWSDIAKSAYKAFFYSIRDTEDVADLDATWEDVPAYSKIAWEASVRQAGKCIEDRKSGDETRWRDWKPPQ